MPSEPARNVRFHTGDQSQDDMQAERDSIAHKLASIQFLNGKLISGEPDASQPYGVTDGVTFTTGQTKELRHGLGRRPLGFFAVDSRTSAAILYQTPGSLTAGLEKTHIRLTHSGASTTICKIWVF